MLDYILSWVVFFNDSTHVADFQQYFGIGRVKKTVITQDELSSKKSSLGNNNSASLQTNGEEYIIHNKYWYWFFKLGTSFGSETFYSIAFPFCFWNIDSKMGRKITLLWAIAMFIGQCLKDIVCWPRPQCPPVVRLDTMWALEYGMPSTHSLASVVISFSFVVFTADSYQYPIYLGVLGVILWCLLVSCSRLYLGMHSVADILGGILLAVVMLSVFLPMMDTLDLFLLTHPAAPAYLISATVGLMIIYPGSKFSSAKEDTAVILGFSSGLLIGAWLCYQTGSIRGPPIESSSPLIWPSNKILGLCLLRTVIGFGTLVISRALTKSMAYTVLKTLIPQDNRLESKTMKQDLDLWVKLGGKLITYTAVGVDVMWFAPYLFRHFGIERPDFHREI